MPRKTNAAAPRSAGKNLNRARLTLAQLIEADFRPLAQAPVLIVGDLILDHSLWGTVERTTPEAPVPIVLHERDSWGLGGAANVAQSVAALGGCPFLIGAVGNDPQGERLRKGLDDATIDSSGIVESPDRPTTIKTRVMSMGQQLLRIDREKTTPLPEASEKRIVKAIERLAKKSRAILLSDYAKGVLSAHVIAAALAAAAANDIPVLVDPKGRDYSKYKGADLLTPNLREATLAVGHDIVGEEDLRQAGRALIRKCGLQALVVTMGPEGMALARPRRPIERIPARAREVFDVTGAGDTTIATLTLGLAAGLGLADAAALANHAGGIVVGKLGVATVSTAELRAALAGGSPSHKVRPAGEIQTLLANHQSNGRKIVFTNGCFDLLHSGHIHFLHEARRLGDILVVGLNTDRSVRAIKGPRRPVLPQDERAAILSALEVVDYVVFFDGLTPEPLLERLRPDVLVKGANIAEDKVVGREIVERHGGRVCLLPVSSAADPYESIVGQKENV